MNHAARTPFLPSVRLLPVRDSDTRLDIPDKFLCQSLRKTLLIGIASNLIITSVSVRYAISIKTVGTFVSTRIS